MAERDAAASADYPTTAGLGGRRGQMYFFSSDGSTLAASTTVLPFQELLPDSARIDNAAVGVGGAARFPATTVVRALLCRIDSSLPNPACRAEPTKGNRIAVTMVADV